MDSSLYSYHHPQGIVCERTISLILDGDNHLDKQVSRT